MSLLRGKFQHSLNFHKKKNVIKRKPSWDDTVSDLSVHRATPEELAYRKIVYQSRHKPKVQQIKCNKQKKARSNNNFGNSVTAQQLTILKEIFYDKQQLHNTLEASDQMLAKVQDICGDNPKRFAGFPAVTTAPVSSDMTQRKLLSTEVPELQSKLDELSSSIMNSSALNEGETDSGGDELEAAAAVDSVLSYQTRNNMEKFRKFLDEEVKRHQQVNNNAIPPVLNSDASSQEGFHTPENENDILGHPRSAANDTMKIKKTRKYVSEEDKEQKNSNTTHFKLNELKKIVDDLQFEISVYEQRTGKTPNEYHPQETFSGYTVALFTAVTKLSYYLRETEEKFQNEKAVTNQLTKDVAQLRTLVDGLTSELILTQEEFLKIHYKFDKYKKDTEEEITELKKVVASGSLIIKEKNSLKQSLDPVEYLLVTQEKPGQDGNQQDGVERPQVPLVNRHLATPIKPAVQLSPPVQKTRLVTQHCGNQQTSLVGLEDLVLKTPNSNITCSQPKTSQIANAASGVNIAKPATLMQSNIGISLQSLPYCQAAEKFPLTKIVETNDVEDELNNRETLTAQIAELSRQHEAAEDHIKMLLQKDQLLKPQQSPDQQEPTEDCSKGQLTDDLYVQSEDIRHQVSPPISPISQVPDDACQKFGSMTLQPVVLVKPTTKAITVSLPKVR